MTRKRPRFTSSESNKQGLLYQELVGFVIQAFDPNAKVKTEQWITGPDGRRDMDVLVQGTISGVNYSLVIECKDYNPKTTGKVGIEYIDALDSKKQDLGVDAAMICSNSGFTADAIRKAKRKHIGVISILKAGDSRIKAIIEEEIYTRRIKIESITTTFRGDVRSVPRVEDITFHGLPVINWVMNRILNFITINPLGSANLLDSCHFKVPITMDFLGIPTLIEGIDIYFSVKTKWMSQIVIIDASLGMYDYIRGKIRLVPGHSYIIRDVNFDTGIPIEFIPQRDELGAGLLPGEIKVDLMFVEGLNMVAPEMIPDVDEFIVPEDLELKLEEPKNEL